MSRKKEKKPRGKWIEDYENLPATFAEFFQQRTGWELRESLKRCRRGGRWGRELPSALATIAKAWALESCDLTSIPREVWEALGPEKGPFLLDLVREVAKLHGGRVTTHSTPATGSTFVLTLPCAPKGGPHVAAPNPDRR